jgi:CxxC motif-containing protein
MSWKWRSDEDAKTVLGRDAGSVRQTIRAEVLMPELICIACPIGCRLTIEMKGEGEIFVTGNRCPKGEVYGREEMLSPKRVVTAVVRTDSRAFPYIPVRTDKPLPRALVSGLIGDLAQQLVRLPAVRGTVLIEDYRGSGVNVVTTRSLPPEVIPATHEPGKKPEGRDRVSLE